ncbi:DUF4328 domain-containing protein [Actinokineospora globicatena]|uniref:DUF4328 domain-containing protein n=1 Tax=Actinokineospora globicatena TaxID=103729 RepID=A0A9W6QNZ4_9PSEU|nr:DUF4328 domain-containing protein [Actinokineospora globicatena]GLW92039.1 hypothetical protein Aglo03_28550 [Actinokineospora globicatena]
MHQGYEWVATPPPTNQAPEAPRLRLPYLGPPRYRTPPRWGFPALAWRWPTAVVGIGALEEASGAVERVRGRARFAASALWLLAAVAVIAAGAEVWRYVLLLDSRTGALSRSVVQWSDSLVTTGAVLSIAAGIISAATVLWWLHAAREAAAETAGYAPAREDWRLLPGLLLPGPNLIVPGAVLAELEHAILRRPAEDRPRPSPLLTTWWIAWAASGLLFATTLLWRLHTSVQAQADGVLLSAATNLTAAAVAILTIRLVDRLSLLLAPIAPSSVRRLRVVRVKTQDAPTRAPRPTTATR